MRMGIESAEVVATIDDDASGLGFLPDGTPIVVSMYKRQILKIEDGKSPMLHADLSTLRARYVNDMVVTEDGQAYVDVVMGGGAGSLNEDKIVVVDPDGSWRIAADNVDRPNGLVIMPDGKTLVHASTGAHSLTAHTIESDGSLSNRREWANTGDDLPDGICLDADGAIWLGGLTTLRFVRVLAGGAVVDRIDLVDRWAIACMLGGPDRTTLFLATAHPEELPPTKHRDKIRGYIEAVEVDVPGAGRP